MNKFYIVTLGCPKNEVDSEVVASLLTANGYRQVVDIEDAEIVLINTCTFIDKATEDSIQLILELAGLRAQKIIKLLVVFGCLAQRWWKELKIQIPEIDVIWGTSYLYKIPELITKAIKGQSLPGVPFPNAYTSFQSRRLRYSLVARQLLHMIFQTSMTIRYMLKLP